MMKLNHAAYRLDAEHFETIVDMLKAGLGFVELRRTDRAIWLRQPGANVDLQFSRSQIANRDADKLRSQVSFLSETPRQGPRGTHVLGSPAWAHGRGRRLFRTRVLSRRPGGVCRLRDQAMRPELADYGAGSLEFEAPRAVPVARSRLADADSHERQEGNCQTDAPSHHRSDLPEADRRRPERNCRGRDRGSQ